MGDSSDSVMYEACYFLPLTFYLLLVSRTLKIEQQRLGFPLGKDLIKCRDSSFSQIRSFILRQNFGSP